METHNTRTIYFSTSKWGSIQGVPELSPLEDAHQTISPLEQRSSPLSSLDPISSISWHCKQLGPSAMFECVGTRANQVFNSQEHSVSMTFWTIRCAATVAPYPLHIAALAASLSRYITTCDDWRRWLHKDKAMCTGRSSSSYIGLSEASSSESI